MKPILQTIKGEKTNIPPIWMMRQAGRYLPEYRKLRAKAGSFLNLVYDSKLAAEITMQPIRRYKMDGAILFSDILIVPHAMGCDLDFVQGEGPVLSPIQSAKQVEKLTLDPNILSQKFDLISRTVQILSEQLPQEGYDQTALIGFAGSPFTVACYMVEGRGSKDFLNVRKAAIDEDWFEELIETITEATIFYLKSQIEAGAELVKLFDSWAGLLDEDLFRRYVITPTAKIIRAIQEFRPDIPVIGFPRGAGMLYASYARETRVTALALDMGVPLSQAIELQKICPVQGNLDPAYLLSSSGKAQNKARQIITALSDGPHIFNLGHGVDKQTNPQIIDEIIKEIRK